jgi:ATP-dependent DNA helicase RecG
MPTKQELLDLFDRLDEVKADELEDQRLDFKEWDTKSYKDTAAKILEAVICMANGGGGTVVVGVNDKKIGRKQAILGVPADVDVNQLKRTIYEGSDPKLTPTIEELPVPEGTGRLIVLQVHAGMPPYTDTKGHAKIRVGKECQPLTGSMRRQTMAGTGETDFTAVEVPGRLSELVSPAGMERLREIASREQAPKELLRNSDADILRSLGLIRRGHLTRAGLLLVGKEEAIAEEFAGYAWTYLRMKSDINYDERADGKDCLATALTRIEDRVMAHNNLTTVQQGLFHFEFRTYPVVALREAILNAFCHADYRIPGPIQVKQFRDRLEISNPGAFIGGISPHNILRHDPVSRNPLLVNALTVLRLVNRSNLGVRRMYQAMLQEGKEPPIIRDEGDAVRVVFLASDFSVPFRTFIAEEANRDHWLSVEDMLVIQYLLRHGEIDLPSAAQIRQQEEREAREGLRLLASRYGILESYGRGKDATWRLRAEFERRLTSETSPTRSRQAQMEAAISTILRTLRDRHEKGKQGLSNADIRKLTSLDREQVKYIMRKIKKEGMAEAVGRGGATVWHFVPRS